MTKLLVSVDEARSRLQISNEIDPTDLVTNIESAVSAAQLHVASILETRFDAGTDNSVFHLKSDSHNGVRPEGVFRLYLPTGLLKSGTVMVRVGDKWNTALDTMDSADYDVDMEKGVVFVDELYADKFVKVSYGYGLTPETTPAWLKEVILSFVPVMFFMPTSNSKADPGTNVKEMKEHANTVADGHLRKAAFAIRPMK